jgi:hypothetical protein
VWSRRAEKNPTGKRKLEVEIESDSEGNGTRVGG